MIHEESYLQSADGIKLYFQRWEPKDCIEGVICLVHGLGEHSSRYTHWAERLTGTDYVLSSMDLRGHGRSGGQLGDALSYENYLDDISLLLEDAASRFPGKPLFLYGHSLGGLLSLYYLIKRKPELAGVVVTSPAVDTDAGNNKLLRFVIPVLTPIIPKISFPNKLELPALSKDQEVVEAYKNDPLVHDRVTVRMARGMILAVNEVNSSASEISIPILIMHGSADRITYPSGSRRIAGSLSSNCELKVWEDCYHELHNEPEKEEVFQYLLDWLNKFK